MKRDFNSHQSPTDSRCETMLLKPNGFSMTEVLVACAIIGILAAVAIPGILSMLPHWRLKGAARQLYTDMQDTRLQAIKNNQAWAMVFDAPNRLYRICSANGADGNWSTVADNTVVRTVSLAVVNLTYGSGNAGQAIDPDPLDAVPPPPLPANGIDYPLQNVVFNPQGTISTAGFIYLQNQNNSTYAVGTQTSGVIMIRSWGPSQVVPGGVWD